MMRILSILTILLSAWIYPFAQSAEHREIKTSDERIVLNILVKEKNIKPQAELHYTWFEEGKIKVTQGGFNGKLLHGVYKTFDKEGNLKMFGQYEKGLKNGVWNTWASDGHLVEKSTWKKGVKHGETITYNRGQITQVEKYKGGKLNGRQQKLVDGQVSEELFYKKGEPFEKKTILERLKKLFQREKKPEATPLEEVDVE